MSRRAEEIKKRIAQRKKNKASYSKTDPPIKKSLPLFISDEEKYHSGTTPYDFSQDKSEGNHPLFRADLFILKVLISAVIVLVVAILDKNDHPALQTAKMAVSQTFEQDFQFASVSSWYRDTFGDPLALFNTAEKEESKETDQQKMALPASGKVLESFEDTGGQGIMVETSSQTVKSVNEGIVVETGEKPDIGLTVVLQHADGSYSWYGNLEKVNVPLYEYVESGKEIGQIKGDKNDKGTYYFAIKKGENFIDPIQVISSD
ncbi:M23 family metallopeptidase [Metabacillus arenae]|uniref:M23 family metallopeptidase n=1 Tax=Metabacillus arenae TaxID=2771434 RepID=A0A926NGM8_9BACI|nr:M23 family metallopeptidase [Metabacillus arenae]MBD1381204.1 M23 family metallopeptidase [Metabacillus arenae]